MRFICNFVSSVQQQKRFKKGTWNEINRHRSPLRHQHSQFCGSPEKIYTVLIIMIMIIIMIIIIIIIIIIVVIVVIIVNIVIIIIIVIIA